MSDNTFAFYDADRDAVILRAESGHEIDVLTRDDAASLGRELLAAAMRQDTGYAEFLDQENGDAQHEVDEHPDTDAAPYSRVGSGDEGYDEAAEQEAELAALREPQERTYAVLARFLVRAASEDDASGQVTNDLSVHPDVEEVWTETVFTD